MPILHFFTKNVNKKFATQMEIETKSDKVPINSRFIRVYVIAFGAYLHLCGDFFHWCFEFEIT